LNPHVALNPESRVSSKVLVHPSHICQIGESDQGHFGLFSVTLRILTDCDFLKN
jgi:hypothetical protein